MKKVLLTIVFQIAFAVFLCSQNTFFIQKDMTGLENTPYLSNLESTAKGIDDILPTAFKGKFKVYDYSLFIHLASITGAIQSTIENIKEKTKTDNSNSYYLLIIRENSSDDLSKKVHIFSKLPKTGEFSCNTGDLTKIIEQSVSVAITNGLNDKYNYPFHYAKAEEKGINVLKNHFVSLLNCCQNNTNPCICPTTDEIKSHFEQRGYVAIPIKIGLKPLAISANSGDRSANDVEDYADLIYTEKDLTIFPKDKYERDATALKGTNGNLQIKYYITKNENFCDIVLKQKLDNEFNAQNLVYAVHEHIWKSPDNLNDVRYIKFFPHSDNTSEYSNSTQQFQNPVKPLECEPKLLSTNTTQSYATTSDPGTNQYFGYKFVNGQWIKSKIAEFISINPTDNVKERIFGDKGAYAINHGTKIRSYTTPDGQVKTETYNDIEYYPCEETYDKAIYPDKWPTQKLVDNLHFWMVKTGSLGYNNSKYYKYLQFIFDHFKYKKGIHHTWYCDSEVSKDLLEQAPVLKTFNENQIQPIIKDWLKNHDDLDNLFTNNLYLKQFNEIQSPELKAHNWQQGLLGGTQRYKIQIRDFEKNNNCFDVTYILTVYDTYGFGLDDANRPIQLGVQFPGLNDGWVLQHYRNYDTQYCTNPPCFVPISTDSPGHSFQISQHFQFCR